MSISVQNISKSYKKIKAVDNVSFEVNSGELFGLIGPDGAGKTTIFRILTTLLVTDEGKATVADLDVVNDYKTIRNSVGYMPGKIIIRSRINGRRKSYNFCHHFWNNYRRKL